MVKTRTRQLTRVLHVREQQARLIQLELLKVDRAIREQQDQIDALRKAVSDAGDMAVANSQLPGRSAWINQSQERIAGCQQAIVALQGQRAEIEVRRQQHERESEALSSYRDKQLREERTLMLRAQQLQIDETSMRKHDL